MRERERERDRVLVHLLMAWLSSLVTASDSSVCGWLGTRLLNSLTSLASWVQSATNQLDRRILPLTMLLGRHDSFVKVHVHQTFIHLCAVMYDTINPPPSLFLPPPILFLSTPPSSLPPSLPLSFLSPSLPLLPLSLLPPPSSLPPSPTPSLASFPVLHHSYRCVQYRHYSNCKRR